MSAASPMLSEEQFQCSICLSVFTDPVTTPCGHNFCKNCITHHWDVDDKCKCPLCAKVFHTRPELHVNTFISEMAHQVKQLGVIKASVQVQSVEKGLTRLLDLIKEKQKTTETQAEGFFKELEKEISELRGRSAEMFLQNLPALSPAPPNQDWTGVHSSYEGTMRPQKVGVFVDYAEGLVSFYDVDTTAHIYSFTGCNFTDKLYPIFSPCSNSSGDNAAPLVITPMFSSSGVLSEEEFQCSICLEVFTDPVTTPCGHNFCRNCLTNHWNIDYKCKCPLCAKIFHRRPELHVNTFISGIIAQVKQWAVLQASSVQRDSSSGEDLLNLITDELIDPEGNPEGNPEWKGRICKNHGKPLEMFCKSDQRCVCISCTKLDHEGHHIVPLRKEYKQKKASVEKDEAEIQQKIQERQLKIKQIKESLKHCKVDAHHVTTTSVQAFAPLVLSVKRSLAQLFDLIEQKQKSTETQAEYFIKELEKEISVLRGRHAEMEQLLHTEDHIQFLQSFLSLSPAPPNKDWAEVRVHSSYEGTLRSAVVDLERTLLKEMRGMCVAFDLKRVQLFAVDITLDPDTASPDLTLTNNKKKVYYGKKQSLPNKAERFSKSLCVLGKESFSAGKFYFEVQVKAKKSFDVGVALGSINRKENIRLGSRTDLWVLSLRRGNQYRAMSVSSALSLTSRPQKVGVFVDYEEGLVSFYDADTTAHIYSFTGCNFTDKLYPIFSPCSNSSGDNAAPLVITPVSRRLRSRF
ncbi:E3 ubiquitin-protein ligase TRIM21-like [Halichoeres trimaculatus]|uniref:E3 ubiquitin-protein ligase TRIM21-like n=1 Tax=Halichoeres trimaculatus TaxID=147232 RepID=UPI003D9EA9AA